MGWVVLLCGSGNLSPCSHYDTLVTLVTLVTTTLHTPSQCGPGSPTLLINEFFLSQINKCCLTASLCLNMKIMEVGHLLC